MLGTLNGGRELFQLALVTTAAALNDHRASGWVEGGVKMREEVVLHRRKPTLLGNQEKG